MLLCFLLIYKLYHFSIIILNIESDIEYSLDILEARYNSMHKILQKEVFFDSIEVRQVISDIKLSHEAILVIANNLTRNAGLKGEIKKESIDKIEE